MLTGIVFSCDELERINKRLQVWEEVARVEKGLRSEKVAYCYSTVS